MRCIRDLVEDILTLTQSGAIAVISLHFKVTSSLFFNEIRPLTRKRIHEADEHSVAFFDLLPNLQRIFARVSQGGTKWGHDPVTHADLKRYRHILRHWLCIGNQKGIEIIIKDRWGRKFHDYERF
jgi:hypothetical protein